MKKVVISAGSLIIMAFVIILFVNARETSQETKETPTEVTKNCPKHALSTACKHGTENMSTACDPAKCKEMNCDPTTCVCHGKNPDEAGKTCDPDLCPETCHMKTPVVE